jgi:hypothetical protein
MTPLMKSERFGVVNSVCRYSRRLSTVFSMPRAAKRLAIVGWLSSAARIPLPGETSARDRLEVRGIHLAVQARSVAEHELVRDARDAG